MDRKLFGVLALAAFVALASGVVFARASKVVVDIPFSFIVDGKTYAAGRYEFYEESAAVAHMRLRNLDSNETTAVSIVTRIKQSPGEETHLVFDKVGDDSYLSEIHFAGTDCVQVRGAPGQHTHISVKASK